MDKTKIRAAAAQGVSRLKGIDQHFAEARAMADAGNVEGAARKLAPLKDELLGLLDTLNFAGVRGLTERPA
jgi:hypothetical protein